MFAGSIADAATVGMARYAGMMRAFMRDYMDACAWLGVTRNLEMTPGRMAQYAVADDG